MTSFTVPDVAVGVSLKPPVRSDAFIPSPKPKSEPLLIVEDLDFDSSDLFLTDFKTPAATSSSPNLTLLTRRSGRSSATSDMAAITKLCEGLAGAAPAFAARAGGAQKTSSMFGIAAEKPSRPIRPRSRKAPSGSRPSSAGRSISCSSTTSTTSTGSGSSAGSSIISTGSSPLEKRIRSSPGTDSSLSPLSLLYLRIFLSLSLSLAATLSSLALSCFSYPPSLLSYLFLSLSFILAITARKMTWSSGDGRKKNGWNSGDKTPLMPLLVRDVALRKSMPSPARHAKSIAQRICMFNNVQSVQIVSLQ